MVQMKALLVATLLILAPFVSQAQIVSGSVKIDGASNVIQNGDNNFDVYGSFLGLNHGEPTKTFDSCNDDLVTYSGANFPGCNTKKVGPTTRLTISFSDTQQFEGSRQLLAFVRVASTTTGTINTPVNLIGNVNIPQATSNYTAMIEWRELCVRAGGNIGSVPTPGGTPMEACVDGSGSILNGSIQVAVGVGNPSGTDIPNPVNLKIVLYTPDPTTGLFNVNIGTGGPITGSDGHSTFSHCPGNIIDNTGNSVATNADPATDNYDFTCDFAIWPGDNKVRLEGDQSIVNSLRVMGTAATVGSGSASSVNVPLKGIIIYTSDSFAGAFPGLGESKTINLRIPGDETTFDSSIIQTAYTRNDEAVFARMASVDLAGNVTHLTGDTVLNTKPECAPGASASAATVPVSAHLTSFYVGAGSCPYATVPTAVYGILDKDFQCFIATALRGTSSDYQVEALREFRRRYLNTTSLGKKFIKFYYTHGPQAAQWIHQNPKLKPAMQVALWPAYFTARVFNTWGALGGLVFLLSALTAFAFTVSQILHMGRRLNSLFK